MNIRFWLFGALALALVPRPASAWEILSFASSIAISRDASIAVTETIGVDFGAEEKHGIFRTIPFRYETETDSVSVPIDIESVMMDGQSIAFDESSSGDTVVAKIGDPERTISGRHQYVIQYSAAAAVNFFDDHDELYWNVTGHDWEVPLRNVSADIHFSETPPPGVVTQLRCLTGPIGSTAADCQSDITAAGATVSASDAVTVVVGWPVGIVTKPDNYEDLRAAGGLVSGFSSLSAFQRALILSVNGLGAIVIIIGFIGWWLRQGRDPKSRSTVVVQYDPPGELRPGEVGTLFDERAETRDVIATIIDLAVRGYLRIEEIEKDRMLGLRTKRDYRFMKQRDYRQDSSLKAFEQSLLISLFADGDQVELGKLKGSFHQDVQHVREALYTQLVRDGFFSSNPDSIRKAFWIGGAIVTFLGFFLIPLYIFIVPIAGVAALVMGKFMPQRTIKGVDAAWHARGFRQYLETAEKYRLQWQEKEKIFETMLPYAMAFGVAKQWTTAFQGLSQESPSWYVGSPGSTFNSLVLWSALSDFSSVAAKSFSPPAASGSSGFGGGGFSGGGFGGGGGGSW